MKSVIIEHCFVPKYVESAVWVRKRAETFTGEQSGTTQTKRPTQWTVSEAAQKHTPLKGSVRKPQTTDYL